MVETDQFYKFGIQSTEKLNFCKEKIIVGLPEDESNGWKIDMVVIWSGIHFTELELPVKQACTLGSD